MSEGLDGLYTGKGNPGRTERAARSTAAAVRTGVSGGKMSDTRRQQSISDGNKVSQGAHADAYSAEPPVENFIDNLERLCGGNKCLEGIILGDILNSPRFRNFYRR